MAIISPDIAGRSYQITYAALTLVLLMMATNAQAEDEYIFSRDVPEQTITFSTVNPYTNVPGSMTITFSGVFHANRLTEPLRLGTSDITGNQRGRFTFTPDDASQPTINGKFRFGLGGATQPQTDKFEFYFRMDGRAQDGSIVTFIQGEEPLISELALQITFAQTT